MNRRAQHQARPAAPLPAPQAPVPPPPQVDEQPQPPRVPEIRQPKVGEILLYRLGEHDCQRIVDEGRRQHRTHNNHDLGQVVPEELGGDLRYVVDGDKIYVEPLGKAKLYVVTKHLAETMPAKPEKFVIAEPFEPKYFNGTYKLYDDGRRSGRLTLKVEEDGSVSGAYYSDKDGRKYEVRGKVGTPKHAIQFTVQFPNAEQVFQGYLFTGDGKALTGSSRMAEREAGFYALRLED